MENFQKVICFLVLFGVVCLFLSAYTNIHENEHYIEHIQSILTDDQSVINLIQSNTLAKNTLLLVSGLMVFSGSCILFGTSHNKIKPPTITKQEKKHEENWVKNIHRAIDNNNFVLYCQPIIPVSDKSKKTHFEILIRYVDENNQIISPISFIPIAEKYDLMPTIDRWVIEHTFSFLQKQSDDLLKSLCFAINLSGASLNDPDFLKFIQSQMEHHDITPSNICFEITETVAISNITSTTEFVSTLRRIGCQFALDDFGIGLSSFGYLKSLPIDVLKIDGMFIRDLEIDPLDLAIVDGINHMGHVMKKETIAEFVETNKLLEIITELGIDYAQGYGIAKPMRLTTTALTTQH